MVDQQLTQNDLSLSHNLPMFNPTPCLLHVHWMQMGWPGGGRPCSLEQGLLRAMAPFEMVLAHSGRLEMALGAEEGVVWLTAVDHERRRRAEGLTVFRYIIYLAGQWGEVG